MNPSAARSISAALCTRNGRRFIGEQIASLLAQSLPITELVVSDDASTDGTVGVVTGLLDAHPDVRLRTFVNSEPLGVVANFEQAIRATTGDIVLLSDQDDVWHADRVQSVVDAFESDPDLLLVFTDADLIDDRGRSLGLSMFESLDVGGRSLAAFAADPFGMLLRRNIATGATIAFRRALLDAARPFPADWVHDEWLAITAAAVGGIAAIPRSTIDYRQHGGNQIGAPEPTLRRKVRRVLMPRGDRNVRLASQFATLHARMAGMAVRREDDLRRASDKSAFERGRRVLPSNRLRRILPVVRTALRGDYERFASRGRADILRDLVQPP